MIVLFLPLTVPRKIIGRQKTEGFTYNTNTKVKVSDIISYFFIKQNRRTRGYAFAGSLRQHRTTTG